VCVFAVTIIKHTGTIVVHMNVTWTLIPHGNVTLPHSRDIPDSLSPHWDFPWTCSVPSTQCCNTTAKLTTSSSEITIRCQRPMQIKNNCLMNCERTAISTSLRPKLFLSPSPTPKRLEPFTTAQLEQLLTSIQDAPSWNIAQDVPFVYRSFSSVCSVQVNVGIEF
jgi:hypothetical protein